MTGFTALMRSLRKPALALVASAGLVAWSAGAASATLTVVPAGQEVLAAGSHLATAALTQSGAAIGFLADGGERQQSRTGAGGADPASGSHLPRVHTPLDAPSAARSLPRALAHARSGRESAPSTGPPSFPF